MEHGIARLKELPLSLRLVRELHERLMSNVRGEDKTPGEFRRPQNWIGPPGSTPETAPYVPPPPTEMMACLDTWERFLHVRDEWPDLVQCALMHEQFEAIHPFLDGNGRVGRLLITLFLIERERLSQPLLYLSAYIEAHRQDYYDLVQRTRTHGDWTNWIRFFLTGIAETAAAACSQAVHLMDLRENCQARVRNKPRAHALVDELFVNPYTTIGRAAKVLKVSPATARTAVLTLEQAGLLEEISGRKWGRLYVARSILDALDTP
jgi:Fic family protein